MQQPKGSYFMTGNNMKYNMQTQNQFGRRHNSIQRDDSTAGLSSVPGYPKIESSSSSTDLMNQMINNNSQFPQKTGRDDGSLDDILRNLSEDHNLGKTNQKWSLTVTSPVRDTGVTEMGNNTRSVSGWQTSQTGPTVRSEVITKETVSRSTAHPQNEASSAQRSQLPSGWNGSQRSPPEVPLNKWGLSKPRMWSCEDRKNEAWKSPQQPNAYLLSHERPESAPLAPLVRSPETPQLSDGSAKEFTSSGAEYNPRPHYTLARSKSTDYRNCASDSEDPLSWLEEQHSKLRIKRDATLWRQRSQQEKRLLSELKTAQNTIRRNKNHSQSDTEDAERDDFRANPINGGQTLNRVHENIGQSHPFVRRDKFQTNGYAFNGGTQRRIDESEVPDGDLSRVEGRHVMLHQRGTEPARQESPSARSYTGTVVRNGRASVESVNSNGSMNRLIVSPTTPRRGESSREAVAHALESNFSTMKRQDTPSLDEVERSLILTLESLSRSKRDPNANDTEPHPRLATSEVSSSQHQKVDSSPVTVAQPCVTPNESLEEVIELKPIGQGVHRLEPANDAKSMNPTSYPVQVVVSPFPLSPVTPYDNQGVSTVSDGGAAPSSTSKISKIPDNMTYDLQQQHLIRQQLLQQQVQQQQLQQQLQQLQQLQQQHQVIQEQLQEQRHYQQQIQQQQQQIEPRVQQHMMQQQQILEQQLLQQQQQLLILQQQLQQQQIEQEHQLQDDQSLSDNGRLRNQHSNGPAQTLNGQRLVSEVGIVQQQSKPGGPASVKSDQNANVQQQHLWQLSRGGTGQQKSVMQQQNNTLQQKTNLLQPQHQVLSGQTLTAQHPDSVTKQESEFTRSHVEFPVSHHLQQQPAVVQSSGPQRDIVETVIQKVHVAVSGGDRGIPSLESVLGHQQNKVVQFSDTQQQQQLHQQQQQQQQQHQQQQQQQQQQWTTGRVSDAISGLTIDTAMSAQGFQKSPSTSSGSGQSFQSPNQAVRTVRCHDTIQRAFSGPASPNSGPSRDDGLMSPVDGFDGGSQTPRFVRDTSQFWHKPNVTRDEVIAFLRDKTPGSFIIRSSNTFQGAFGLAVKVAQIPPNVQPRSGDLEAELVRHFLIESTPKGVRLKGCSNEPTFGSLAALVYQHTIMPLALPCKLILPDLPISDVDSVDAKSSGPANNEAQAAGSNVLYISSTDLESLTGPEAITRAIEQTFVSDKTPPKITEVHFKVSAIGITLTDNKRRLFFRRHYPFNTITHCSSDVKDRRWTVKDDNDKAMSTGRVFGFVARKMGSTTENTCHLFSDLDPTQPATAIVNFVTKVMISGSSAAQS